MRIASVSLGSCGIAAGGLAVRDAIRRALPELGLDAAVGSVGCTGLCYREPVLRLRSPELGELVYGGVSPERVPALLRAHFLECRADPELRIDQEQGPDADFIGGQRRVVLRNCGRIDPESLDDYLAAGGYDGLRRALRELDPEQVIEAVMGSGLRGRGGAGFPTGTKWRLAREAADDRRFVVCNADEGDPGAFMDRNLLEGDPFSVLEGMTLAAYAAGASRGFVYVRDEYPLAVSRIGGAIEAARARGYLGERILDTGFDFDVSVMRGAGAFVCGEETAMIASIEGRRGVPVPRPPYPVERGLWGHPTVINNVETLAGVARIMGGAPGDGPELGGTKVFSLSGDVRRTGMVEVPIGTSLRAVVERIGGGAGPGREVKAVQIGGPSGGCIPASLFDTPIDYEALAGTGAIMGSGGLVVLDATRCMVDVARYFLGFTQRESCGWCTFCRVGTRRMLDLLDRICGGTGSSADLERLEALAESVRVASLCGLGRSAPNPVLTTLRYFREEYEAHLRGSCPAGRCRSLVSFRVDPFACEGCATCRDQCPAGALHGEPGSLALRIDPGLCLHCGGCREVCPFQAVGLG